MNQDQKKKTGKLNVKETALYAMLGALMFASKVAMQSLPNIHLVGLFIVSFTVVYRRRALYPVFVYILLEGLFYGFTLWWIPYLFVWPLLWAVTMLLPQGMKKGVSVFLYAFTSGLHGLFFGTLFAPFQALFFGLNFKGMVAWILQGLPYDLIHGASNFVLGFLTVPLIGVLRKMNRVIKE